MQNFVRVFFEIGMSFEPADVCGGKQKQWANLLWQAWRGEAVGVGICLDLSQRF
jgi:hypothetical protein